jgi:hypothetical protein
MESVVQVGFVPDYSDRLMRFPLREPDALTVRRQI